MKQKNDLQYTLSYKPKRKPNIARWMTKHNVSSNVMSIEFAIPLAIERLYNNDLNG